MRASVQIKYGIVNDIRNFCYNEQYRKRKKIMLSGIRSEKYSGNIQEFIAQRIQGYCDHGLCRL